jgi:hypothetical protein
MATGFIVKRIEDHESLMIEARREPCDSVVLRNRRWLGAGEEFSDNKLWGRRAGFEHAVAMATSVAIAAAHRRALCSLCLSIGFQLVEAKILAERATHIKIPQTAPERWQVEYRWDREGRFLGFDFVKAKSPSVEAAESTGSRSRGPDQRAKIVCRGVV